MPQHNLTPRAISLLRKVAEHILEEPRRLNMNYWRRPLGSSEGKIYQARMENGEWRELPSPPCGTIGCIKGWADELDPHVSLRALLPDGGLRLFYVSSITIDGDPLCWPTRFRNKYLAAKTPRGRAAATVARIEHYIKTDGEE